MSSIVTSSRTSASHRKATHDDLPDVRREREPCRKALPRELLPRTRLQHIKIDKVDSVGKDRMRRDFFLLGGGAIGYFEEQEYPFADGRYRYMPYRGPGHLMMQRQVRNRETSQCYYEDNGRRVSFRVRECPEYGVLVLSNFEGTAT
jgi:hypothetical protein